MTEKYIALFQTMKMNDYKRTCIPVLAPAAGAEVLCIGSPTR